MTTCQPVSSDTGAAQIGLRSIFDLWSAVCSKSLVWAQKLQKHRLLPSYQVTRTLTKSGFNFGNIGIFCNKSALCFETICIVMPHTIFPRALTRHLVCSSHSTSKKFDAWFPAALNLTVCKKRCLQKKTRFDQCAHFYLHTTIFI